jgi:hypothetical protein
METLLQKLIGARRLWVGGPQNAIAPADRRKRDFRRTFLC